MKTPKYLTRDVLEGVLEYIKESGNIGRIYRQREIGEILTRLGCLGCIKSHDVGLLVESI